jgi:hypothetical protein
LVWNTETLYNGHRGGDDVKALLNRIGEPYGFSVDDALDNYEPPQKQTLAEFRLEPRALGTSTGAKHGNGYFSG